MSPQAKKTTWVSAGMITLVFTAISLAYTTGLRMSASAASIREVSYRVTTVQAEVDKNKENFMSHCGQQAKDMESLSKDTEQIKSQLTEVVGKQVKVMTRQEEFSHNFERIENGIERLNDKIH